MASAILNEPEVLASNHVDDVSQLAIRVFDRNLPEWLDNHFCDFIGFSVVNLLKGPPLDVAVVASRDEFTVFKKNDFDCAIMQRNLLLAV